MLSLASTLLIGVLIGPLAQDPPASPAPAAPQEGAKPDPFAPDEALARVLGAPQQDGTFEPLADRPLLPAMKLKGYLSLAGRPSPAAAVEIEGYGTYVAHRDSRIAFSLNGRFPSTVPTQKPAAAGAANSAQTATATRVIVREQIPIVLLVKEISPEGVVVEVGTLGQTLVIR